MSVAEGAPAPQFSALGSDGSQVSLQDFRGKWVILYFYPRDNTPGCTKQACGFRDVYTDLADTNAVVLGCSGDSLASHEKFINKFDLPFILLSDPDHTLAMSYDVWQPKMMYGITRMGIVRSTFLIDPKGIVRKIWRKVKVAGHVEEVVAELQSLSE